MQNKDMKTDNRMSEIHVKNFLQEIADIVGEQKGMKISVEVKKKE